MEPRERPTGFAHRTAVRWREAIASVATLPSHVERRLIWWVMGAAALIFCAGVVGGQLTAGEVHPVTWHAVAVLGWSAAFVTFRRRPVALLLFGVAAGMAIVQSVVRDPRIYPTSVLVLVAALVVAFPFSPVGLRRQAVGIGCVVLLLLDFAGGGDTIGSAVLSLVGMACLIVGYRILGELESAMREAEADSRALLDTVAHAPVVAMAADCSEMVRRLSTIPLPELTERLTADAALLKEIHGLGRVTWMNENARRAFGISELKQEVRLDRDLGPSDPVVARGLLEALARRDKYYAVTAEAPAADGESRWFHAMWVLPPERVDRCFLVATDVTEVVEARRQLEHLIDDKNRFLATISHELRTPLTAVLGFTREAEAMAPDLEDQPLSEFLQLVVEQAEEMSFIIEDLLTAARADAGSLSIELRPIDIGDLARRVAASAREPVVLLVEREELAMADPVRVRQILRNLVSNAVRYGGSSRSIGVSSTEGGVVVEVANDGPPVPPDMVDSIFDPYVSAHEPTTATGSIGLGLAVSRQLALLMGGDLVYLRRDDQTVFRLSLPSAA